MHIAKFYRNDPLAPKPTKPARLGANAIITCNGKILLEKRRDCEIWGLIGGGVKNHETELEAIIREVYEEIGLRIPKEQFKKIAVYGEPGRIAAYSDGSVWRMVIVVFKLELGKEQELAMSSESKELRFFSPEELKNTEIVVTHSDIVEECFLGNKDL